MRHGTAGREYRGRGVDRPCLKQIEKEKCQSCEETDRIFKCGWRGFGGDLRVERGDVPRCGINEGAGS